MEIQSGNHNLLERAFIKGNHRWKEYLHPQKKQKESQLQKRIEPNDKIKNYLKTEIEPVIVEYISNMTSELTYSRSVKIIFNYNGPWEVNMIKNNTVNSEGENYDSIIAIASGRGIWHISIDGKWFDYELIAEWNVPREYLKVSLTMPKLERLLNGERVLNFPGEVFIYLNAPQRKKIDNSIIDELKKTVEMFVVGDLPLDNQELMISSKQTEIEEQIYSPSVEYKELETEMKGAIASLGWRWKDIDRDKMDQCIRETLDENESLNTCLTKYLKKE